MKLYHISYYFMAIAILSKIIRFQMLYHKNNNIGKVRNMNMYNSETYEPREDIEFQKAIDNGLSEDSVETYRTSVKMFCEINNKTYEEIVLDNAKWYEYCVEV